MAIKDAFGGEFEEWMRGSEIEELIRLALRKQAQRNAEPDQNGCCPVADLTKFLSPQLCQNRLR